MSLPAFANPRKAIVVWTLALIAVLAFTGALNYGFRLNAREMRENDFKTYIAAADECMNRHDYPEALKQAEEAKRRAPNAPEPYAVAGHVRYQLRHWGIAITEYQAAIARGSCEEGVFLNIVWALIELKRYPEAAELGTKALTAGISQPALPRYIAEAYFRDDKMAEAVPYYEMSLKGYSSDLYLLDHLARSLKGAGQKEKAEEIQRKIADIEASLNNKPQK
jgi:tetratricopeptide (TPR) repeat protein